MISFIERRLVFPARKVSDGDWNPPDLPFEDVTFTADDGTKLHGWYVPHAQPRAVVLYSHGNGECVPHLDNRLRVLNQRIGVSVFAWDYRGYGRSEGKSHESNVVSDARTAQLWLADRANIDPDEVVLIGRSLGGAVSVALAAEHAVAGLVLDRTFSCLLDTAAHNIPWFPVRCFMSNRFSSAKNIRKYHGPLLQSHGTADEVIPLAMGKQLFEASPSKQKRFLEIPNGEHNGPLPDFCYEALIDFLDSLK